MRGVCLYDGWMLEVSLAIPLLGFPSDCRSHSENMFNQFKMTYISTF